MFFRSSTEKYAKYILVYPTPENYFYGRVTPPPTSINGFFWRHMPLKIVVVMQTPASKNALPDMGELLQ